MSIINKLSGSNAKKMRGRLIACLDNLLDRTYKHNLSTTCRTQIEEIRSLLLTAKLRKNQYDSVNRELEALLMLKPNEAVIQAYCKKLLLLVKDELSGRKLSIADNDITIAVLCGEITDAEATLTLLTKEMEDALDKRDRVKWEKLSNERRVLTSTLNLKRSNLSNVLQRAGNIKFENEAERALKFNEGLLDEKNGVDVSKIVYSADVSKLAAEKISAETAEIDSVFDFNNNDDFDALCESYAVDKKTSKSPKNNSSVKRKAEE